MTERRIWWQSVRDLCLGLGAVALYALGLPWLFVVLGKGGEWLLTLLGASGYVLILLLILLVCGLWYHWRQMRGYPDRFAGRLQAEGITYLLLPDRDLAPRHPAARTDADLWAELGDLLPRREHLALDLLKRETSVAFVLQGLPDAARAAATQIMAHYPGTQVRQLSPDEDPLLAVQATAAWWCALRPTDKHRPVQAAVQDPCLALLSEVARLPGRVQGGLQVLARHDPYSTLDLERRAIRKSLPVLNMRNPRYERYRPLWEVGVVDQSDQRDLAEWSTRARRAFLDVQLVVWASAETEAAAKRCARQLAQTVIAQYGPSNPLKVHREGVGLPHRRRFTPFGGWSWTDQEIGSLLHLVGREGVAVAPNLQCATARILPPAVANHLPASAHVLQHHPLIPGA